MTTVKMLHGANPKMIKTSNDLYYLESYVYFADFKYNNIRLEAEKMFDETGNLEAVDKFLTAKINAILAVKYKKQANLSKRFSKRTFDNFNVENDMQKNAYEKALKYAEDIEKHIESGTNIIFYGGGSVGTGKTHLACAIANKILEKGIPVKVLNIISLVDELKEFTSAYKRELKTVKVLLIDDLGKENGTLWLCSEIYGIINARYENELPTIITTEGRLSDLEDNYKIEINEKIVNKGASMISRLTESSVGVNMAGDDYRKKKERYANKRF